MLLYLGKHGSTSTYSQYTASQRGGHYDLYCVHLSICWYREVYVDRLMYHHYNSAQCTDTNILIYQ